MKRLHRSRSAAAVARGVCRQNGFNELQQAVLVEIIAEMRAEWQKDIEELAQRKAGNVEQLIREKDVA